MTDESTNTSELEKVREAEEHNFRETQRLLGNTATLSDDYAQLYELVCKLAGMPAESLPEDQQAAHLLALHFAAACRYQLTMGTLCVFRGHLNDSLVCLRRAIELCGFAALVRRHPHKAMVWLRANDNDKSYRTYQEKFSNKALFPPSEPVLQELYERYDRCSKVQHSSIYSLAGHLKYDYPKILFNYFDLRPNDHSFVSRYYYVLDTHRRILSLFAERIFPREIRARQQDWDVAFHSVDAKTNYHREYWKQFIPNPLAPRP